MSNKLSDIKRGDSAVQTEDLPVFTHLLNVSAEEILSAGTCFFPLEDRYTNYKFASSKDEKVWEEYINREDKIILNTDEYGKTVLDYAVEFKNYDLLKYMTEKGYIWFVGKESDRHCRTFGAGTKIKKKEIYPINMLEYRIQSEDCLRMDMIIMALEHKDYSMLTELRAREVPSFFLSGYSNSSCLDDYDKYSPEMIQEISKSDEATLKYFSEEFNVEICTGEKKKFIFPYMNELLKLLIKNDNAYAMDVLNRCYEHNSGIWNSLIEIYKEGKKACKEKYGYNEDEAEKYISEEIKTYFQFNKKHRIVKLRIPGIRKHIHTNIIYCDAKTDKLSVRDLIERLNTLYNNIVNLNLNCKE